MSSDSHTQPDQLINSSEVRDAALIKKFISIPDFPWLISFPRTGSHWLRMVMELYFGKPSLVRIFYYPEATEFTCYHRHDQDLNIAGIQNVIYLYRHPLDTVYSQMNYYHEDIADTSRMQYWSELYGKHLSKWLLKEKFTRKKTILTYEGLKRDFSAEFSKVCSHFGQEIDLNKMNQAVQTVSKDEVKKKTVHDPQVINLSSEYERQKDLFQKKFVAKVMGHVYEQDNELKVFFP